MKNLEGSLRCGEPEESPQSSASHIVVFSRKYPRVTWCLVTVTICEAVLWSEAILSRRSDDGSQSFGSEPTKSEPSVKSQSDL